MSDDRTLRRPLLEPVVLLPEGETPWGRLHPLTPVLSSGRAMLVVIGILASQGIQTRPPLETILLALLLLAVVLGIAGYLSWRAMSYRVAAGELQIDSGILQKRKRRVPLARLQSVDVVRPLLARALGLAELKLEVAGGGQTEAPLAYLTEQDAHQLRRRLLALSAGTEENAEQDSQEQVIVEVPLRAMVVANLLGVPVVLGSALVVALLVTLVVEPLAALGVLLASLPLAAIIGITIGYRLLSDYGFTVARSDDGLRLRRGLLETRSQTIPEGRVQTIRILEPVLWRRRGWVRVEVDVAGYAHDGREAELTGVLLPVAPKEFALSLVEHVLGATLPTPTHLAPRQARWRAPLEARHLAVGVDAALVVSRWGVLTRRTDVVPISKVQSLRLTQGPWQRRLGLATAHADSAGRRLAGAFASHQDARAAQVLITTLAELSRQARRDGPITRR